MSQRRLYQVLGYEVRDRFIRVIECLLSKRDGLVILADEVSAMPAHFEVQPT
jgi:hypothetical protein